MNTVMTLFFFILPLVAVVVSLYTLYHILTLKKVATKITAAYRISGKDVAHE